MRRSLVILSLLLGVLSGDANEKGHPNIVYIISDDQSWNHFGFMGEERVYTPNLDALAEQSLVFPNGYLTSSVCRPSLVTLLTGLYQHQHEIHFNHGPPGNAGYNRMQTAEEYKHVRRREFGRIREIDTLPRLLFEELGYESFQTGKFWEGSWDNGGFTAGMTQFVTPPPEQTFGGIRTLASGEKVAHGNGDLGLRIGREGMEPIREFIRRSENDRAPWLVWYAPYLPHQPHDSPEQYYDLVESTPGVLEHEIPYFASIAQFDATVGELMSIVEKESELSETVFVFVCDNGWTPSKKPQKGREIEFAHTKQSKRAPFDEGVRSPILICWDGEILPRIENQLVSSVDIVPTLLHLAGVKDIPAEMPGEILTDLKPSIDRAVFGATYPGDATQLGDPAADVAYRWVRKGKWKLILPVGEDPWGGFLDGPGLFDVLSDPTESQNLAEKSEYAALIAELMAELDAWWSLEGVQESAR